MASLKENAARRVVANGTEDECTSLLASSSPPSSAPAPAGSDALEPPQPSTTSAIEEVEREAKALAGPSGDQCDTDSVNGLLAGVESEEEDDDDDKDDDGDGHNFHNGDQLADNIGRRLSGGLVRNDPELADRILRHSLNLSDYDFSALDEVAKERPVIQRVHESTRALRASLKLEHLPESMSSLSVGAPCLDGDEEAPELVKAVVPYPHRQVIAKVALTVIAMACLVGALLFGAVAVGPPRQPVGEYKIVEAQVGEAFWQYYDFYAGSDSAGSNGFINYVSKEAARRDDIVKVVKETVPKKSMIPIGTVDEVDNWLQKDLDSLDSLKNKVKESKLDNNDDGGSDLVDSSHNVTTSRERATEDNAESTGSTETVTDQYLDVLPESISNSIKYEPFNPDNTGADEETFVYISSSATPEGPRNSVRLEGRRRFNRGLFIIDLRHMPAGCGTWPAFWLTDEANWPVNGEIDIVEGVSYQDTAKTALHATQECRMDDIPEGANTGGWDTAVGIPDRKTGIPDMTFRNATDCFVYEPHQWLNQGCVATDLKMEGRSLGVGLNDNGGGVYALEWDPINHHIRSWVFAPHARVPRNLRDALRSATNEDVETRIAPDTNQWGLPYGYFPIGDGTTCPSKHFRNMRLVINLAFCGSVAGNRYFMDCPNQFKDFKTCNEWVASNPEELQNGAHWKIRGVYVYEREWLNQWDSNPQED